MAIDRRERGSDATTALLAAFQGWQGGLWTALPAVIVEQEGVSSFNPVKRTVALQPTLQAQVQKPDGTKAWVTLPLLVDVVVVFPSGGGVTLTFPLRVGDEGLVVFASRCIDSWWQSGGVQTQAELRMHDLSDGFFLAGVSSVPNVIPNISATAAQLRDDAGTTYIEVDPGGTFVNVVTPGDVTVTAAGAVTINAAGGATINAETTINGNVTINGNLDVSGSVTSASVETGPLSAGSANVGGINFGTHRHTGVEVGGGASGGPTA